MRDKKCVICGKIYPPTGKAQLYCSKECFRESERRKRENAKMERTCEWCGKKFIPRFGRYYCSPECSQAAEKKYHREYNRIYDAQKRARRPPKPPKPKKIRKPKECPVCHAEFVAKDYRKTFCSPECRKIDLQKRMHEYWRIRKAELAAEKMPVSEHKPVYRFSGPAPKAAIRCNVARLPESYVRNK